jgi:hypothetical protein
VDAVLRLTAAAFLAAGGAAGAAPCGMQDAVAPAPATAEPSPSPTPSPGPSPRPSPRPRPIRRSAERQIEAVVRAHLEPCEVARRTGVPCFPVSIETEGPRFSVKEALRSYRPDGRPAPGVPTNAEMQRQMSGAPRSPSGGVSTDPVCAVKSLVRLFKGSPNTFFLYRTWNVSGEEQPLLTDHKLDPNAYASPALRYEYVGEFKGECEALAAWRAALRRSMAPPAVDEEPARRIEAKPVP